MENLKINTNKFKDDLEYALRILDGTVDCNFCDFDDHSMIYRVTNEKISDPVYINSLKNRKRVLSITASGDQVINSILFGGKDIRCVDISRFPKYFLELKIASLLTLEKIDYLEFILSGQINERKLELYEKVRKELSGDILTFWDSIFSKYVEINAKESKLFNRFTLSKGRATISNPYLQEENYKLVKDKIKDVSIDCGDNNLLDEIKCNNGKYDLILLSNLYNYFNRNMPIRERIEEYKKLLKELPLRYNGIAVTYNFTFDGFINDYFNESEYKAYSIDEEMVSMYDLRNELIVYKKDCYQFICKRSVYNFFLFCYNKNGDINGKSNIN